MPNAKRNYKPLSVFISLCIVFALFPAFSVSAQEAADTPVKQTWTDEEVIALGYIADEVIVKFKESAIDIETETGIQEEGNFRSRYSTELPLKVLSRMRQNSKKMQRLDAVPDEELTALTGHFLKQKSKSKKRNEVLYELGIDDGVMETIEELKNDPDVEAVMPNYIFPFNAIQWNLGFIHADEAWNIATEKGEGVIVAVIDSGIAYDHDYLAPNMWNGNNCINNDEPGEPCPNHGWNFLEHNSDTNDYSGHGTHVAGIIGAVKNQTNITEGVSSNVTLMALKVGDAYGSYFAINKAIDFARENGADIINGSFGGYLNDFEDFYSNPTYYDYFSQFNEFLENGGLFVAAAGNRAENNDLINIYPGNYLPKTDAQSDDIFYDNIISVAATNENDELYAGESWGSNYGKTTVDIAAPGAFPDVDIISTYIKKDKITETFGVIDSESWGIFQEPEDPENTWSVHTVEIPDNLPKTLLLTDIAGYTYVNNSNYSVRTRPEALNLSELKTDNEEASFGLEMDVSCDTEPMKKNAQGEPEPKDYIEVALLDENGEDYEIGTFDENNILVENSNRVYEERLGVNMDEETWDVYKGNSGTIGFNIPDDLLNLPDTVFQFTWVTDEMNEDRDTNGDLIDHRGCYIDNVRVTYTPKGETGQSSLYEPKEGTSMSAPHVAGVAALIKGHMPGLTAAEIKHIIMQSGDDLPSLDGKTVSGKRLNAGSALALSESYVAPDIRIFTDAPEITNVNSDYADSNEALQDADISFPDLEEDNRVTFRILNSSRTGMTISTPVITGASADQFAITKEPAGSLATQYSSSFIVTFEPTSADTKNAAVSIDYTNGNGNGTFTLNLTAEGEGVFIAPQEITVEDGEGAEIASGGTLDFGYAVNGSSVTKNVIIRNDGEKTLTVKNLSIQTEDGSVPPFEFRVNPDENKKLIAGATMTVPIDYTPQESGIHRAVLYIVSDDEDETIYKINLKGISDTSVDPPPIILEPTIHSTPEGGVWDSTGTWEEERLPTADDIVEINGYVSMPGWPYNDVTVKGILVNENGILQGTAGNFTLQHETAIAINGDILNKGTISDASRCYLDMNVSGNIQNNGTISNYHTNLDGWLENNGTISSSDRTNIYGKLINNGNLNHAIFYVYGDIENNGVTGPNSYYDGIFLYGENVHRIVTTNPIDKLAGNGIISGNFQVRYLRTSSNIMTLEEGSSITITGQLDSDGGAYGTDGIINGDIFFSGENLILSEGTHTINGNVEITAGSILKPAAGGASYNKSSSTLVVDGNITNKGEIQPNNYAYLYIRVSGNLSGGENIICDKITIFWPEAEGADGYEIAFAEEGGSSTAQRHALLASSGISDVPLLLAAGVTWGEPVSVAGTQYDITSKVNQAFLWKVRAVVGGQAQEWSEVYGVNMDPDTTPPVIEITAPTKLKNSAITDTSIHITDDLGISVNGVTVNEESTAGTSGFQCAQISDLEVECDIQIDSSGDLKLQAEDNAGNSSEGSETGYIIDEVAPELTEVTPVPTPSNNPTPEYTFSSSEAGEISYGGSCGSEMTEAVSGENTVMLDELDYGTYDDCFISVTDEAENTSEVLYISSFTILTPAEHIQKVIRETLEETRNIMREARETARELRREGKIREALQVMREARETVRDMLAEMRQKIQEIIEEARAQRNAERSSSRGGRPEMTLPELQLKAREFIKEAETEIRGMTEE